MYLPKGSRLCVQKTQGLQKGNYDLYDIKGLSFGKLLTIVNALELLEQQSSNATLAREVLDAIGGINASPTINGK